MSISGDNITRYEIADTPLDAKLTLNTNSVVVKLAGTTLCSDAAVLDDANLACFEEDADYTLAAASNGFTVTFTAEGRARLDAANATRDKVTVTFTAAANTDGEAILNGGNTDGVATNAKLTFGVAGNDAENPAGPVGVDFGGQTLIKQAAGSTERLAGATIKLFATEADARAYAALPDIAVAGPNNDKLDSTLPLAFYTDAIAPASVAGINYASPVSHVVTDDNGVAFIAGLKYGAYWVLEVQAPEGYELLTDPFVITVDGQVDDVFDVALGDVLVENVPHNAGFGLPLTGSIGTTFLTVIALGAALIGTLVVLRRKAPQAAATAH